MYDGEGGVQVEVECCAVKGVGICLFFILYNRGRGWAVSGGCKVIFIILYKS